MQNTKYGPAVRRRAPEARYTRTGGTDGRGAQCEDGSRGHRFCDRGKPRLTCSALLSDDQATYDGYADEPADCIVGRDFEENLMTVLHEIVDSPGTYELRAHYEGFVSNWLTIEVGS